jgi:hypothetical protein
MVCSAVHRGVLALLLTLAPAGVLAQADVVLVTVAYESPDFVAPVALLALPSPSRIWTLGLVGSTATIERVSPVGPLRGTLLHAEFTPFNANASHYVYRNGVRDQSLSFRDASATLTAGLRVVDGRHQSVEIRATGRYESVGELPDSVLHHWRSPYYGLGAKVGLQSVVSDDVFRPRVDGVRASADGAVYFGSRTWWRGALTANAGKKVHTLFARVSVAVLLSGNTDIVSRYLVGGSWDDPEGLPLYGHRYAEFRVDRGLLLGGGADLRVAGELELGLRFGYLQSPSQTSDGMAARLGTVWNGLTLQAGVGGPTGDFLTGRWTHAVAFAGVSAAVLR